MASLAKDKTQDDDNITASVSTSCTQTGCQCDACLENGSEIVGCSCGGAGECSGYCSVCQSASSAAAEEPRKSVDLTAAVPDAVLQPLATSCTQTGCQCLDNVLSSNPNGCACGVSRYKNPDHKCLGYCSVCQSAFSPTKAHEDAWSITAEQAAEICIAALEARASELGTPLSPEDKAAAVKWWKSWFTAQYGVRVRVPGNTEQYDRVLAKGMFDKMMEDIQKMEDIQLAGFLGRAGLGWTKRFTEDAVNHGMSSQLPEDSTTKETDGMSSQLKAIMLEEDDKQYVGRYAFNDPNELQRFGTPEEQASKPPFARQEKFFAIVPSHVIELKDDGTARAVYFRRGNPSVEPMIVTITGTWATASPHSKSGCSKSIRITGLGVKRKEVDMGPERPTPGCPERSVSKESEAIENAVLEIDCSILKENASVKTQNTCTVGDIFLFAGCDGDTSYNAGDEKLFTNVELIDEETFNRRFNLEHYKIV